MLPARAGCLGRRRANLPINGGTADASNTRSDRYGSIERDRARHREGTRRRKGSRSRWPRAVRRSSRRPCRDCVDEGFDVHGVAANLAEEAEVQKVVAAHRERYGRLDVLVNNAGVGVGQPWRRSTPSGSTCSSSINFRSIVLFYRETVDLLRAAGAEHKSALVVNTASISGKRARGMAVGLLGDEARRRRLDRSDEQGARRRRRSSRSRCARRSSTRR